MARAAAAEKSGRSEASGAAGRVAARRRPPTKSGALPASTGRKKKVGGASKLKRRVKLALLVLAFLCIGFFGVLVVDVGSSVLGKMQLGETTVVTLWQKVLDRVLDRDVPRPVVEPAPKTKAQPPAKRAVAKAPVPRAPVAAERPEDDARHSAERKGKNDPEVDQAKRRLDELLGRL